MRHFKFILIPFFSVLAFIGGIKPAYAQVKINWDDFLNVASTDSTGGGFGLIGNILSFLGSILTSLLNPVTALAGFIARATIGVVVSIVNAITLVIGWLLFGLANGLIELALELNSVIQFSSVVQTGFGIVLNIANLGLVVAIVAIAFMVMLRRPGATKLLPRFIAVALLINFSFLIITNFFLEPVNQITEVLRQAANFDFNSFGKVFIVDTLDFGQAAGDLISVDLDISGWVAEAIISLLGVLFFATFIIIGFIVLMAFAMMLMVRYVALSILIILMPIAWVAWIFPNLKIPGGNPSTVWWENFTRWLLFAPISMFFFFLAIQTTTAGDILDPTKGVGAVAQIGIAAGNMFIVVGFLVGGLVVANKMSITGAGYALGITKKLGNYAKKRAKGTTIRMASAPLRNEQVKKRLENLQKKNIPVLGKPIKAAGRGLIAATDKSEKFIVDQTAKKYENMAPYRIAQIMANEQASDLERMSALKVAQEKGYAWEVPAAQLLDKAHKKKLFDKFGMQKTKLGISAEGLPPEVVHAIKSGESPETVKATMREKLSGVSSADLSSKLSGLLLSDFSGNDAEGKLGQHGLKEAEFESVKGALTQFLIEDRPNVINSVRNRLPGPAQAHINTALETHAGDGGTFEAHTFSGLGSTPGVRNVRKIKSAKDPTKAVDFKDASAADKQLFIQEHWSGVKTSILRVETVRINARSDIDSIKKAEEITKAGDRLDKLGPQGVIAQYTQRERARKGGFIFPFSTGP